MPCIRRCDVRLLRIEQTLVADMDQTIRNKLRNVVTQCRKLLEDAISQELEGKYGIFARKDQVTADPNAAMSHLSDEEQAARKDILDHFAHIKARRFKPKEALDQLVREIAFTHLNRLCAYKMMEAREVYVGGQKFREAVSRGVNSNGVKFYLAEHEDDERLFNTGQQDVAYRHFLDWLGGALSEEIGVLFNPNDPANRLYPRQNTLDEVLDLLNGGGIKAEETELREQWPQIWSQDEAIGWVYQYFTPKELRDQARKESSAPRNSYELAFRNQFFTPRYVVEFLTDNTLSRIWYEMRKGDTQIKDQCRYMVRRPIEIFLKDGQQQPSSLPSPSGRGAGGEGERDDLSQEELLKLPVYIPHRPKKDPRELKILDPACGSGHFLLYCFDLLLTIYEEAYADPDLGPALQKDYPTLDALKRDVPRLILAHNLHGIDIDLRASQIAVLALWLRCQRAYQDMGLKKDRPKITRSNFVCAEPMPGEESMLKEFVGQLEPKVLGQVVEVVFDKMKLAGEAGSLLKIEEEIRDAVAAAKKQWVRETAQATDRKGQPLLFTQADLDQLDGKPEQQSLFDFSDLTDDQFFEQAESRVIETLRSYAEKAQNGQRLQRRLFSEDAVRGFAFVDLCQKRYDVVLMNPPFGDPSVISNSQLQRLYTAVKHDVASAFVERAYTLVSKDGRIGCITTRTLFFLSYLAEWREDFLLKKLHIPVFVDFGLGVLEAFVETGAYVLTSLNNETGASVFVRSGRALHKGNELADALNGIPQSQLASSVFLCDTRSFAFIPRSPFAYWVSARIRSLFRILPPFEKDGRKGYIGALSQDDERFLRLWWEPPSERAGRGWTKGTKEIWVPYAKGGIYSPFYSDMFLTIKWENDGEELKAFISEYRRTHGFSDQWTSQLNAYDKYFRRGITWSSRPHQQGSFWVLPKGCIFGNSGPAVLPRDDEDAAWLLAVLNSRPYRALLDLLMPRGGAGGQTLKYELGYVRSVPIPPCPPQLVDAVQEAVFSIIRVLRRLDSTDELSHLFVGPFLNMPIKYDDLTSLLSTEDDHKSLAVDTCIELCESIEHACQEAYGLTDEEAVGLYSAGSVEALNDCIASHPLLRTVTGNEAVQRVLSWCMGVVYERWASGMLNRDNECARTFKEMLLPIPIEPPAFAKGQETRSASAIIPDDPDHTGDIVRQMRGVLELLWKGRADAIEKEVCEFLGVKELRDYFRKPGKGGFWDDHISRYSKSRRKAPIYWLLQSSKKNYALWLYYHRLDKDLLFKALVNYVEPKIRLETSRLETLRSQKVTTGDSGKEAKRLAKDAERQEDFLSELRDFEDKLRRAANLHLEPDLNDGVVLNIAPLHELVPWKEAQKYWDELLEGKYEWSSIGKQLREKGLVA